MSAAIAKVFLTSEFQPETQLNYNNSNTDVIVQMDSGEKYIASFLTYENLESLRRENLKSGAFLNGKYYWMKNMLLIDDCSKERIKLIINHLLDEGNFDSVFKKI